jgi:glucosyl-dolichyl phosphate glucuronosyltransferase
MKITTILCTYNHYQSLARALDSLAASVLPEGIEWEVLVVDNNSNDHTRQVAEDFCKRYPGRFRYLFEPCPGKSYALNAGIRHAHGEILAFVDDDVIVQPAWLHALTSHLRDSTWAGAAGRILPRRQFASPIWLSLAGPYDMGGVLALFDRGDEPGELDWLPYGTNMAFRKSMFEKYGEFRVDLGPSPDPTVPRQNEDIEFGRRLRAAGERLRYEPSAVVYHDVPERRLRKEYFLAWWFGFGRSVVHVWGQGPDVLGIPRPYLTILKILITRMPQIAARWMMALQPQRRFFYKSELWRVAGEITEFYSLARRRNDSVR